MLAASRGHVDMTTFLVSALADVNAVDIYQRTTLHMVVRYLLPLSSRLIRSQHRDVIVAMKALRSDVSCDFNSSLHTHTHTFNGPLSGTTRVSRYQKGKTNLDITEARDSEWQWHQLGHMQVCTSLQTDNHASTPLLSFLQAGCPSCCPTDSVKALNAV